MFDCGEAFGLFIKWIVVMSVIAISVLPAVIHILSQAGV